MRSDSHHQQGPEKRCPICGALWNVEECAAATHAGHNARAHERAAIVELVRGWGRDPGNGSACAVLMRLAEEIEGFVVPSPVVAGPPAGRALRLPR